MKINNLRKQLKSLLAFLSFIVFISFFSSCDKSIEEVTIPPLVPSSIEETGGTWKAILIGSPGSLNIAAPLPTSSSEYLNELQEVKTLQANLTASQKAAIKYWSAGGVVRWNEIIRELVAKHNLAPASSPEGTYPVPDALKPTNYPEFPFANPPYAARAYAMLTVAQYDALIAAWHYKYQFNRPAPYIVDNGITPSIAKTNLPSYPSEDAVIASVSLELMKFLFPGDIAYIESKAQEQKNARLWSGTNVRSDIIAGDSLGKLVAEKIIAAGKADGMKTAGKWTPEMQMACESSSKTNFGQAWVSLETPARPPMLPSYGFVKNWLFDEATKIALRPPAPPKLNSAEFQKDLEELRHFSKNITREQFRIVSFWADGTGTYTPPGHWNAIATELIVKNKFSELRTARTYALLNMAMVDAGICCWDTKFYFYVPRPSKVDPSIKTATGVPNFPSYTSGHSTFSGAAATVLSYIFPSAKSSLESMALEASMSRVYACIHYRFDCEVGLKCGKAIGQYAVDKGKEDGAPEL